MSRAVVASIVLSFACSDTKNDLRSIDASRVAVFFPVDRGIVYGRGFAGAADAPFIYVAAHPARTSSIRRVEADGSFSFDVVAESGDLLEIAPARSENALERGAPIFVRVPTPANETIGRFYCCAAAGTCQSQFEAEEGVACREPQSGLTRCAEDSDCFFLANEVLPIDVGLIEVSPPSADGRISIEGTVLAGALVTVENRALSGLGVGDRRWTSETTIADLEGRFRFDDLSGRGDDELVIQLRNLENLRSPPAQLIVPDPELATLDVISAEGWERVIEGRPSVIAVRVAPGGIDGRGICPDSDEDPSTCFTGGLFHSMIPTIDARLARAGAASSIAPRPAPIIAPRPHVVGAQGEVRDGPRGVVIAIDMSADAGTRDPPRPRRFAAAAELVRRLRDRDRVGLVTIGGDAGDVPLGDAQAVIARLEELESAPTSGPRDLFAALARAAPHRPDNVVAIMTGDVSGTVDQALDAAAVARAQLGEARVDIVTVGAPVNLEALRRLARYGDPRGDAIELDSISSLERAVYDLAHELVGSFILLYEVDLPPGVGKQDCIELELTASIDGRSIEARFRGVVTFEGAAGDPSICE